MWLVVAVVVVVLFMLCCRDKVPIGRTGESNDSRGCRVVVPVGLLMLALVKVLLLLLREDVMALFAVPGRR